MKGIIKVAVAMILMATLYSCEKSRVKHLVENEKKAQVVWLREDSCYSVTRPLMSARYKATKATQSWCELAHEDLMQLSKQMNERDANHGGFKVRCYWVGYTYDGQIIDSTVVMVEPSGELVTEMEELNAWMDAAEEIGKICNSVFR